MYRALRRAGIQSSTHVLGNVSLLMSISTCIEPSSDFDDASCAAQLGQVSVFHCGDSDLGAIAGFRNRLDSGGAGRSCRNVDFGFETFCLLRVFAGWTELRDVDQAAETMTVQLNKDNAYQRNLFEALRFFMCSKWWDRVWILQEIIVPERATVYCGGMVAPWDIKDGEDLPSWVPDWSASAHDDIERIRAENAKHYETTLGSQVSTVWSDPSPDGINDRSGGGCDNSDVQELRAAFTHHRTTFTRPNSNCLSGPQRPGEADLFGEKFQVRHHRNGVISMLGQYVDTVELVADPMQTSDTRFLTLQSWASVIAQHFEKREHRPQGQTIGNMIRRTLCADMASVDDQTRRLNVGDMDALVSWLLQGPYPRDAPELRLVHGRLFEGVDNPRLGLVNEGVDMVTAARVATHRRTLFVTRMGYIGLGPAKMRVGDSVFVVPGSTTSFILRRAGFCKVEPRWFGVPTRRCELVGDCYAHGLIDGEAMHESRPQVI
ncbi:hypothetical protein CDD83_5836 [Cordyceps sp. RAO-2017]|nr:hypothetical protein CDD83_5836 [Cordyceps sp. RAO-2017]